MLILSLGYSPVLAQINRSYVEVELLEIYDQKTVGDDSLSCTIKNIEVKIQSIDFIRKITPDEFTQLSTVCEMFGFGCYGEWSRKTKKMTIRLNEVNYVMYIPNKLKRKIKKKHKNLIIQGQVSHTRYFGGVSTFVYVEHIKGT